MQLYAQQPIWRNVVSFFRGEYALTAIEQRIQRLAERKGQDVHSASIARNFALKLKEEAGKRGLHQICFTVSSRRGETEARITLKDRFAGEREVFLFIEENGLWYADMQTATAQPWEHVFRHPEVIGFLIDTPSRDSKALGRLMSIVHAAKPLNEEVQ